MKSRIQLVPYKPSYSKAFRDLNEAWIRKYFEYTPEDEKILSNPQGQVMDKGGEILFTRSGDKVVGCCALVHHGDGVYELAKMAVDPAYQGNGIGRMLGEGIVEAFKQRGGNQLYLITNGVLKAALGLYRKMGFIEAPMRENDLVRYTRCDIRMEFPTQST